MGENYERQLTKSYKGTKCDLGLDPVLEEENSVKNIIEANDKIEIWACKLDKNIIFILNFLNWIAIL